MKRAILLARTSYDDRDTDGRNLQGQLDECREYALKKGYTIVAELAEDVRGVSGAILYTPKLAEALDAARAGQADVLVVRELDRFARDLSKQLFLEQEFEQAGAEIDYVIGDYPATPEGDLMKNVGASFAQYERAKIAERMMRAKRLKVKAGNVIVHGNPPYGYRVKEENGRTALEVCESEARIVRLIFRWYVEGDGEGEPLSLGDIARRLSGMETGRKDFWYISTVRYVLKSETYAGIWRYSKQSELPPESMPTVRVPAIVSREAWEAAQKRLEYNRKNLRRKPKYEYLLRRRATCACGLKMICQTNHSRGKIFRYYMCAAHHGDAKYRHDCDLPRFRAKHVDRAVWEWLKWILTDPLALGKMLEAHRATQGKEDEALRAC